MKRVFRIASALALTTSTILFCASDPSSAKTFTVSSPHGKLRAGSLLGVLSLPTINVKKPLVVGIGDSSLARGLGLWPGTAIPGSPGNAVIAGHRTSHGAPMRNIDRLKVGDPIFFKTSGRNARTYEFRITKRQIVKPDAMWITRQGSAATLTIFACHPPHSISYRFVVFARLVTDQSHMPA